MGTANSVHASAYYSECNKTFDWFDLKAEILATFRGCFDLNLSVLYGKIAVENNGYEWEILAQLKGTKHSQGFRGLNEVRFGLLLIHNY